MRAFDSLELEFRCRYWGQNLIFSKNRKLARVSSLSTTRLPGIKLRTPASTVYECFACLQVCVPHTCLVPGEVRGQRGHQIPWSKNYGWLWSTTWVLRAEPGSFSSTTSTLNCWAISPIPYSLFYLTFIFLRLASLYGAMASLESAT